MKKGKILLLLAALLLAGCVTQQPPASTGQADIQTTNPSTENHTQPTASPTDPTVLPTQPPEDPKSILNFLRIAVQPVGGTMYIWGGGWNEADTGAGEEAVTLGISPLWKEFADLQDGTYDYNDYRYHIHKGLDCSGYVGWAVYNILETENAKEGYVCSSTAMAQTLAQRGLGDYIAAEQVDTWLPGDIMSMKGHVWIVVGMCDDGSVLLLHASPPGVIFSGTLLPNGEKSEAVLLAEQVMQTYYPQWYARFPECGRPHSYLEKSAAMRWSVLSDEAGVRNMSAQEVIRAIYE